MSPELKKRETEEKMQCNVSRLLKLSQHYTDDKYMVQHVSWELL